MARKFVPDDFDVPEKLETDQFRLRMLTANDAELDYDAVMSSRARLQEMSGGAWPSDEMTLEENREDLAMHEDQFKRRAAFCYTVMNLDETQCLGCLYINPILPNMDFDAVITMWVRDSAFEQGLDDVLYQAVRKWITEKWCFKNPVYPIRDYDEETLIEMYKKAKAELENENQEEQ